jgi:hypothetical protein
MTTARPKLRWYQFSLRGLLAFMVLTSIGLSWFAVKMQHARRQREAVAAIDKMGGMTWYDYQDDAHDAAATSVTPPTPRWLRKLFGIDLFSDVISVYAAGMKDADIGVLDGFPGIRRLLVSSRHFSDAGLRSLKKLSKLTTLDIDAPITDAGLQHLRDLPRLKVVNLYHTKTTKRGVELFRQSWPGRSITEVPCD